jgi:ABC-2 type transport system permease protein
MREARALLCTPLFWVLSGVFFLANAMVFVGLILGFSDQAFSRENDLSVDITVSVVQQLFWVLHFFLMIQVPLLTMRTFAEERRQGSLALLRTTPVGEWPIVLGKFLGNAGALLVYLGVTLVFPLATELISEVDWPVVFSCYSALVLSTIAYVALGNFFSSLSESQVVAAILSYVSLFSLILFGTLAEAFPSANLNLLANHLTILAHLEGFLEGNVALLDGVYFVVFAFMFLFLTARQLESLRWRT